MDHSDTSWPGRARRGGEPTHPLRTERLFGLPFVADATLDDIVEVLTAPLAAAEPSLLVTPNVDHIVQYARDPDTADVARCAELVLPDGAPVVWASRLLGRRLSGRLTGSDLFALLWRHLVERGRPVVVVGANADVASGLLAEHPSAVVLVAPDLTSADSDAELERTCAEIIDAVRTSESSIVVVALGLSAGHRVAAQLSNGPQMARGVWVVLVGAAPEFHLGLKQRAPIWMQRAGLEWMHRLVREPRRLWQRYLLGAPRFARIVWHDRAAQPPRDT